MVSWALAEDKTLRDKGQFITAVALARVSASLSSLSPSSHRQQEERLGTPAYSVSSVTGRRTPPGVRAPESV